MISLNVFLSRTADGHARVVVRDRKGEPILIAEGQNEKAVANLVGEQVLEQLAEIKTRSAV